MQATTSPSPTPAPAPAVSPALPSAPGTPTVVINNADGSQIQLPVPMNRAEVRALKSQRSELSNQLVNVSSRRHDLATELRSAGPGVDRLGLEQRIGVLDKRIVQLESDIASTGR